MNEPRDDLFVSRRHIVSAARHSLSWQIFNQPISPLASVDMGRDAFFMTLETHLLYQTVRKRKSVMRVSMNDEPTVATLKVEGRVVGPWATELGRTWQDLWSSTKQKRLQLDIRGVTYADQKGSRILREIVRAADMVVDPEER
jgi:hypothetical protein